MFLRPESTKAGRHYVSARTAKRSVGMPEIALGLLVFHRETCARGQVSADRAGLRRDIAFSTLYRALESART